MEALALIYPDHPGSSVPQRAVRVLGIDLGTTNSTISEVSWRPGVKRAGDARCLEVDQPTLEGTYTHVLVPSMVAIHAGGILIGEGAKRLRARASELGLRQDRDLFYECKNDIGIRKTYHRAPEGFRSAAEIGGKVLAFLCQSASENDQPLPNRVVVTVPASFQAAQRQDTLKAAEIAGLRLAGGDLLDERSRHSSIIWSRTAQKWRANSNNPGQWSSSTLAVVPAMSRCFNFTCPKVKADN